MYDAGSLSETSAHQRARGALDVSFKQRDGRTVLDRLRQEGCLKARFPRVEPNAWTMAVTLNSSGGVAGGDSLRFAFTAGQGTKACVAGQAAERFYRSVAGGTPAEVRTRLTVASGAALEWLPQETILFDRAVLDRRLHIELASDASFLGIEAIVFGRLAMGEQVRRGWLRDLIRVRRGGDLILHDAIRLDGEIGALLSRRAIGGDARALATIVHVAPDAEARLSGLRDALTAVRSAAEAAASAWNGMLVVRVLAPDSAALRLTVMEALEVLRDGRPLPRVWMC